VLELWCLTPHSIIFQLCLGGQFYLWRKLEYPEKTIDLPRVAVKLTTQKPKDGEHKQEMNAGVPDEEAHLHNYHLKNVTLYIQVNTYIW
jgi:hypothetical protein